MKLTGKFIQGIERAGRYHDDGAPGCFCWSRSATASSASPFVQRITVGGSGWTSGSGRRAGEWSR